MRALVWFRRDLRVRDNAALHAAARAADRGVIGLFLIAPEQWKAHDEAPCKVQFWLRNLHELERTLADRRIPLIVEWVERFSDAADTLLAVAQRHRCDALHFNREYEVNERRRDEQAIERFTQAGLRAHGHTDRVVLEPGDVLTQEGRFYSVFTPFAKRWRAIVQDRGVNVRPMPRRQAPLDVRSSPIPNAIAGFERSDVSPAQWPAGEDHAKRRLEAFINHRLAHYHERRDRPAVNGTSTLSPYLAAGVLSPRQCLAAAMRANDGRLDAGQRGARTWITELIWREFYQHILVGFPRVSMNRPFKLPTRRIAWSDNQAHFDAWCQGRTGFPIVDAAMRQLTTIGWMHNRLRMIVAMFLSKDLLIDWRRGESFFMRHLIDGDLGANNGGWQWASSTGTDAAPYFRVLNPTTQSRRYDPDGAFIRRYVPELADIEADAVHDPPAASRRRRGYPPPIVDHADARNRAIAAFRATG